MTRTRGRKASRSVARRRVKPNAKRKERKTQRRKSRNIVMRGGAGDISLFYEPNVNPPKCVMMKEKVPIVRDHLYLFFATHISLDEVKYYVCKAMGLDKNTVVFVPEFEPQMNYDLPKYNLNNLFIKLSGISSYSTIKSGYLQRGSGVEDKALVTTKEHKITPELTSALKIDSWDKVVKNLEFNSDDIFYDKGLSSKIAESGYSSVQTTLKYNQRKAETRIQTNCVNSFYNIIRNPTMIQNLNEAIPRVKRSSNDIKSIVATMFANNIGKEDAHNEIISYLKQNSHEYYNEDVNLIRNYYNIARDEGLSDECKIVIESHLGLTTAKTTYEIIDEVYGNKSS